VDPVLNLYQLKDRELGNQLWGPFAYQLREGTVALVTSLIITPPIGWLPGDHLFWCRSLTLECDTTGVASAPITARFWLTDVGAVRKVKLGQFTVPTANQVNGTRWGQTFPLSHCFVGGQDGIQAIFEFSGAVTGNVGEVNLGGIVTPHGNYAKFGP